MRQIARIDLIEMLEVVEVRRSPSRLGAAVARFLRKTAFYAAIMGLGAAGLAAWVPTMPDPSTVSPFDISDNFSASVAALRVLITAVVFWAGVSGLGITVLTGGRKP